jgi:hypothetical protein
MPTRAFMLATALLAGHANAQGTAPAEPTEARAFVATALARIASTAQPRLRGPGRDPSSAPVGLPTGPVQLTNPATGTTCSLMIWRADPSFDPKLERPAAADIDRGIVGSASPCVP